METYSYQGQRRTRIPQRYMGGGRGGGFGLSFLDSITAAATTTLSSFIEPTLQELGLAPSQAELDAQAAQLLAQQQLAAQQQQAVLDAQAAELAAQQQLVVQQPEAGIMDIFSSDTTTAVTTGDGFSWLRALPVPLLVLAWLFWRGKGFKGSNWFLWALIAFMIFRPGIKKSGV